MRPQGQVGLGNGRRGATPDDFFRIGTGGGPRRNSSQSAVSESARPRQGDELDERGLVVLSGRNGRPRDALQQCCTTLPLL